MRTDDDRVTLSPSDLCRFMASRYAAWMDLLHLRRPDGLEPDPPSDTQELVRRKGLDHEGAYLADLEAGGATVARPRGGDRVAATIELMRSGVPLIWQAAVSHPPFEGYADLLVRADGESSLGAFHYAPRELKLAFKPRPPHVIQLCAYAEMLEGMQGRRPEQLEVVLGNGELTLLRTADFFHYYTMLKRSFVDFVGAFDPTAAPVPEPNAEHGRWASHAEARLAELDHLSRVANIRASQIKRLEAAGILTLRGLADSELERVPRLDGRLFERLRRQARLQLDSAGRERPTYELLPVDADLPPRGLALLPPASPGDVYFDMEGYPLIEGGLEYLFGATWVERGDRRFRDQWAHDAEQEKAAFETFVDWVQQRWRADPSMHVYHYGQYEVTALKRLMGRHGSREVEVDQLLRNEVFVDLYMVVRHGLLVGEPRYSIKNLERLFRDEREGEVGTAVDSIVQYQRWLDAGESPDWRDSPILSGIRDYNRDDCDSTLLLAEWLRERAGEEGIEYRGRRIEGEPPDPDASVNEKRRARRELSERIVREAREPVQELLGELLEFHRREDKPMWWEMFNRHAMNDDELYEDLASLGRLTRAGEPPVEGSRSVGFWYRFDPDQDSKLTAGSRCYLAHDLEARVDIAEMEHDRGRLLLRFPRRQIDAMDGGPPANLSLIPDGYIWSDVIQDSIARVVTGRERSGALRPALDYFLRRAAPRIVGHDGGSLRRPGESTVEAAVRIVGAMDATTLSIQGPPGSGKTYTAAKMILALTGDGRRVGVTSNSHKAILNLLAKCAEQNGGKLRCLKVGGDEDDPLLRGIGGVEWVKTGGDGATRAASFPIIAGTAWLFSRPDMQERLDYLFVDEAGQVSLANLVGIAPSTRNLVLIGDQMQLGQPTQGTHPGESGASTLDYLLQGERTIPADRGLFLDVTYRLHPELCRFSSEAFYEGRLLSAPGCEKRRVIARDRAPSVVPREAGIVFVPVEHEGNTQGSDEEVESIRRIVDELVGREVTDSSGAIVKPLALADILFVAPYNMQVRKLQRALPAGARVGSVDKFQGQEAPVVIISMCASEGHDSPRGIEFLLNPNRLNVALTRAQCLAVVVGHPGLARTSCSTIEQLRLVNLYCRIVGAPEDVTAPMRYRRR